MLINPDIKNVYDKQEIEQLFSNLVGGAQAQLNTLNEIANALNNDASFSTTVVNALANKLDSSTYTANNVLSKLLTVDGSGSLLDADKVDGQEGSYYLDFANFTNKPTSLSGYGITDAAPSSHVSAGGNAHATASGSAAGFMSASMYTKLDGIESGANNYSHPANHSPSIITQDSSNRFVSDTEKTTWNAKLDSSSYTASDVLTKIKTVDGTGSGLDADTLDGIEASGFATTSALSNKLDSSSYTASDVLTKIKTVDGASSGLDADLLDGVHASSFVQTSSYTASDVMTKMQTVDGTGSGLDADLLDGLHSSSFATSTQGTKADNALPASSYTASDVLTKIKTVDGSTSGLDADLLDGQEGSYYTNFSNLTNKPTTVSGYGITDAVTKSTSTVTLTTAGWSNSQQTLTVSGVTDSNSVFVAPAPASYTDYATYGIRATAQTTNSLTFTCDTTPTGNISVNVIIM